MTPPLDSLTLETFQPLLDTVFLLQSGAEDPFPLVLIEVRSLGHRRTKATRDPFALTFRGAPGWRLPQGIVALDHPDLRHLELFLVQIGDQASGSTFEAIFT